MVDYKELLKKYIEHVSSEEGVSFIPHDIGLRGSRYGTWVHTIDPFTVEEIEALWDAEGYDYSEEVYK